MLYILWDTSGYFFWLLMVSLFCWVLERIAPWRREQKAFRGQFGQDLFWLVFNGHYAGVLLAAVSTWVLRWLSHHLLGYDLSTQPPKAPLGDQPLWMQFVVFLVVKDFLEWG